MQEGTVHDEPPLDESREAQRVLSLGQVALWLKLPRQEVVSLAESGELPGRLVAGEWRFGVLALNRWLAGDRISGELAALEASIARIVSELDEVSSRIGPLLDTLPRLARGKMMASGALVSFDVPDDLTLEALEAEYIRHVLDRFEQNKTHAAAALGIDASTLYRKLARLGSQ